MWGGTQGSVPHHRLSGGVLRRGAIYRTKGNSEHYKPSLGTSPFPKYTLFSPQAPSTETSPLPNRHLEPSPHFYPSYLTSIFVTSFQSISTPPASPPIHLHSSSLTPNPSPLLQPPSPLLQPHPQSISTPPASPPIHLHSSSLTQSISTPLDSLMGPNHLSIMHILPAVEELC